MSRSKSSGRSPRRILLLLASPPELTSKLVVDRIEGDTFIVGSPDLSESPPWQHQELTLWMYPPPWLALNESRWAPLSRKEDDQQDKVALATAQKLIQHLRLHPEVYSPLREELHEYWSSIIVGLSAASPRSGLPLTDVDRVVYVIMAVFDLSMLVSPPSSSCDTLPIPASINPDWSICRALRRHGSDIRWSLRDCLARIGVHPDYWHEQALLGLLLHPQGMILITQLFVLGPTYGRTEVERGIDLAVEAPDTTYRSANKFLRAYRRARGAQREPERPGPKPGQPRQPSEDWQEFERHVVQRRLLGLSSQLICQDSETQRIYRIARQDPLAELNEQAVRRVLRKQP